MGTKETTRDNLVDAATRLFLEKGLLAVGLEEVALVAGCTRRNLYRYFAAKEDLALEVVTTLLDGWNQGQTVLFEGLTGSGAVRLRAFLDALVDALADRKDFLRLMGEFDFVFQDTAAYRPAPAPAARFQAVVPVTENLIARLLEEGRSDGSLVLPAPAELLVPTVTTVLWSLAQRVAVRDRHIQEEFGVTGLALVRTQVDLILRALSAAPREVSHG